MTKTQKSRALSEAHENAIDLYRLGLMDKKTMQSFDHDCLPPVLSAHCEELRLSISEVTEFLVDIIGRKLTAYAGGERDVCAVDRWMAGSELYGDAEQRLRFAYQVVRTLAQREDPKIIRLWLIGINPELGNRTPLKLIREGNLENVGPEISSAARAFLVGG